MSGNRWQRRRRGATATAGPPRFEWEAVVLPGERKRLVAKMWFHARTRTTTTTTMTTKLLVCGFICSRAASSCFPLLFFCAMIALASFRSLEAFLSLSL